MISDICKALNERHFTFVAAVRDDKSVVQFFMEPRHQIPHGWAPRSGFSPYKHRPLPNGRHKPAVPPARSIRMPAERVDMAYEVFCGQYTDLASFIEHCNRAMSGFGVRFVDNDNSNDVWIVINEKSRCFAHGPNDLAENILRFVATYKTQEYNRIKPCLESHSCNAQ